MGSKMRLRCQRGVSTGRSRWHGGIRPSGSALNTRSGKRPLRAQCRRSNARLGRRAPTTGTDRTPGPDRTCSRHTRNPTTPPQQRGLLGLRNADPRPAATRALPPGKAPRRRLADNVEGHLRATRRRKEAAHRCAPKTYHTITDAAERPPGLHRPMAPRPHRGAQWRAPPPPPADELSHKLPGSRVPAPRKAGRPAAICNQRRRLDSGTPHTSCTMRTALNAAAWPARRRAAASTPRMALQRSICNHLTPRRSASQTPAGGTAVLRRLPHPRRTASRRLGHTSAAAPARTYSPSESRLSILRPPKARPSDRPAAPTASRPLPRDSGKPNPGRALQYRNPHRPGQQLVAAVHGATKLCRPTAPQPALWGGRRS